MQDLKYRSLHLCNDIIWHKLNCGWIVYDLHCAHGVEVQFDLVTFYTRDLHDYIIEWDKSNDIYNYNDVVSDEVTNIYIYIYTLFNLFMYWRKYIILNGGGFYIPHVLEWQGMLNEI